MLEQVWKELGWEEAVRARALALACRLDRHLEEAAAEAGRPESRLATRLRGDLQTVVAEGAPTEVLMRTVAAMHRQLAWLPKPALPTGVRVFLRELFGGGWDDDLVVAALAEPGWPLTVRFEDGSPKVAVGGALRAGADGLGWGAATAASRALPVAVIPQAEMRNPLMWPLVALQGTVIGGWSNPVERVREVVGPGLWFALAESAAFVGKAGGDAGQVAEWSDELAELWRRGLDELAGAGELLDDALELARSLADGVLISAKRVGAKASRRGDGAAAQPEAGAGTRDRDIYEELVAVRDVPAEAIEILSAGWIHWYGHAAPALLAAENWERRRAVVDGVDDILCRSLDVAAIHRFYATEGASK